VYWFRGSLAGHYPAELSALSGSLINTELEPKVPVLFHFCERVKIIGLVDEFRAEEAGVVSLAYLLVRELINTLEPAVDISIGIRAERFGLLESPLGN
jgi:hypothetical protein